MRLRLLLLALVASAVAAPASTPPGLIHYQGVLRSSTGAALDGPYHMVFRFIDAPTGGTLLLTDYHTGPGAVPVQGGLFEVLLGSGTIAPGTEPSLQEVFARYPSVYLEVQVGAETLSPRIRIVPSAYALNAARLGGQPREEFIDRGAGAQTKTGTFASNAGLAGRAPAGGTGVEGQTESGIGVRGTATSAAGLAFGVYGRSASVEGTGVAGEVTAPTGAAWGVFGKSSSTSGVGVVGSALATSGATEGVRGQSASPQGRGVVGAAFATSGPAWGVYGESQSPDGAGVVGRTTKPTGEATGVLGESFSVGGNGVVGLARASSGDAWGVYGGTASPQGFGVVSEGDSLTIGGLYVTGGKYFLAEHPAAPDRGIQYACLEGSEVGVYHRGTGRLRAGETRIDLPEHFPWVASGRITVHLTPLAESGGLFVPEGAITSRGFLVREAGGGRSDAPFAYVVMAERAGHENAAGVQPLSLGRKIAASARLTPEQKASLRAALARTEEDRLDAVQRARVYGNLHQGDYAAACRDLGGCPAAGEGSFRPGARSLAPSPAGAEAPAAASRPEAGAAGESLSSERGSGRRIPGGARAGTETHPAPGADASDRRAAFAGAEMHRVDERAEAGDVVVVGPGDGGLRLGRATGDPAVLGVVAGIEGFVPAGEEAPVVLYGSARCKVDARYGPVAVGDLLTVSPTPGHAMRTADPAPGTILGKALEPLAAGVGSIRVLVTPR